MTNCHALNSLNESPSEKEGKYTRRTSGGTPTGSLNESPSEKEGKCRGAAGLLDPPRALNESPSEKEGKLGFLILFGHAVRLPSMKVPPKRKGNSMEYPLKGVLHGYPSMKVPPKRKGNQ